MRLLTLLPVSALLLSGCGGGGTLRGGTYRDEEATYHLQPLGSSWKQAEFAENDLAWIDHAGHVISVNAVCHDHGDPSLKVLTDHLLLGFEDREVLEREDLQLDGRGAMRTRATAALDGVPVDLEMTLLKKDGCVYDLIYTAPKGRFDEKVDDYRALVHSFHTRAP